MQSLPSAGGVSSPIKQTSTAPQNPTGSIKDPQSIKSALQKATDKPAQDTSSDTSLTHNESMNFVLLSLINQFIEQMQGTGAADTQADNTMSGSTTGAFSANNTETIATSNTETTTEVGAVSDTVADTITATEASATTTLSEQTDALDNQQFIGPRLPSSNADTPTVSTAESAAHLDGRRSLEKVNVSLIGFSGQDKPDIAGDVQDAFRNTTFMAGKFEVLQNIEQGIAN